MNEEIQRINARNQRLMQQIASCPSALPKPVYELMRLIWNVQRMNRTMRELHFDTDKNPLGKLSLV